MGRKIIVSDLHIDTWTNRVIGDTGKNRKEHFLDLLKWCEDIKIEEFIINGDIMDMPPYKGQYSFNEGSSISREVIERLVLFAENIKPSKVTVIFGNHDIGISGFRSMADNNISFLNNVSFCYPNYMLSDYQDTTILIEHGHFFDPFVRLYLKDLADRTYLEGKLGKYNWTMHSIRAETTGIIDPGRVESGQTAYKAAKQRQSPLEKPAFLSSITKWIWEKLQISVIQPKMEWWWSAAIDRMSEYVNKVSSEGKPVTQTIYQIFGHTHATDPRNAVQIAPGISGIYINAGSWTEDADQGPYLDIREDGKVWLQDWINEDAETKRLYSN
ncbi:MAG: metallophosphoesterase [Armatimonadota bacterium]